MITTRFYIYKKYNSFQCILELQVKLRKEAAEAEAIELQNWRLKMSFGLTFVNAEYACAKFANINMFILLL